MAEDEGPHVGDGRVGLAIASGAREWQTQPVGSDRWQSWQSSWEAWQQSWEWILLGAGLIQQQAGEGIVSEAWTEAQHAFLLHFTLDTRLRINRL